jgi:hypothetical protein
VSTNLRPGADEGASRRVNDKGCLKKKSIRSCDSHSFGQTEKWRQPSSKQAKNTGSAEARPLEFGSDTNRPEVKGQLIQAENHNISIFNDLLTAGNWDQLAPSRKRQLDRVADHESKLVVCTP